MLPPRPLLDSPGIVYLAIGLGGTLGYLGNLLQERLYQKKCSGGIKPAPEARLPWACFGALFFPAALIFFAWTGRPFVSPVPPIFALVLLNASESNGVFLNFLSLVSWLQRRGVQMPRPFRDPPLLPKSNTNILSIRYLLDSRLSDKLHRGLLWTLHFIRFGCSLRLSSFVVRLLSSLCRRNVSWSGTSSGFFGFSWDCIAVGKLSVLVIEVWGGFKKKK